MYSTIYKYDKLTNKELELPKKRKDYKVEKLI